MGAATIGDVFDQGRAATLAGTLRRPLRNRVDCQQIVAINTHTGYTKTQSAGGQSPSFATGKTLERGNGPLVVNHVEDNGRLVNRCEGQGVVDAITQVSRDANNRPTTPVIIARIRRIDP